MFTFMKPLEFPGWLHEGLSKEHVHRKSIQEELELFVYQLTVKFF